MSKRSRRKKRGSYKKHKPRRYPTRHKTTTPQGKKEYQRNYMRDYMRRILGVSPDRFGKRGPKPKVIYVKDLQEYAKKARKVA